jgi:hypothetical protein
MTSHFRRVMFNPMAPLAPPILVPTLRVGTQAIDDLRRAKTNSPTTPHGPNRLGPLTKRANTTTHDFLPNNAESNGLFVTQS